MPDQILVGDGFLPRKAARIGRKYGATLVNDQGGQCTCGWGHGYDQCPRNRQHWFEIPSTGERREVEQQLDVALRAAGIEA